MRDQPVQQGQLEIQEVQVLLVIVLQDPLDLPAMMAVPVLLALMDLLVQQEQLVPSVLPDLQVLQVPWATPVRRARQEQLVLLEVPDLMV